jgi:hypothetical protein
LAFPDLHFTPAIADMLRRDARAAGWLLAHDRIAGWTAMQDTRLAAGSYTPAQEDWLREALVEQASPFEASDPGPFVIRFIGHGKFVHRDGDAPVRVAPEYERFRVPRPDGAPA